MLGKSFMEYGCYPQVDSLILSISLSDVRELFTTTQKIDLYSAAKVAIV